MSQQIGFWAVFALVAGSQIGSGVLMQPSSLAPYGSLVIFGWLISSLSAISLALVFSWLCSKYPKTGGPCVYIEAAFGKNIGFFIGWTYWVISWVSTTVLFVSSIAYLSPLLGYPNASTRLCLELLLLFLLTALNLKGVAAAGRAEFLLSLLKVIPLLILPSIAIFYFDLSNMMIDKSKLDVNNLSDILSSVALLTLWGFIGVETATTAAGSVKNPSKTIPKAIFLGTLFVALLYMFNSVAIMGLIPGSVLALSKAPYADAAQVIFGGNWHLLLSAIAAIICIGTANAWTLSSGQAALGLAQDGLLPKIFTKTNKSGAPIISLLCSCLGTIPVLMLTANENLATQIDTIINFSVIAFLFIYALCIAAFFKLVWIRKEKVTWFYILAGIISGIFCLFVLAKTPIHILAIASLFTISGLPVFIYQNRYKK